MFDEKGNHIEELDRFETLAEARAAYYTALRKPRRADRVLILRNKTMVLRSSDRSD